MGIRMVTATADGGRRTDQQRKSYEVPVPPESYRLTDLGAHRKRFASPQSGLYCRTPAWPPYDFESGTGSDSQAQILTLLIVLPHARGTPVKEREKA